jgi:Uma2 family endonuclease
MTIVDLSIGSVKIRPPYSIHLIGVTKDEFYRIADEDIPCELVDGEMLLASPASTRHELVFGFLFSLLRQYVETRDLGQIVGSQCPVELGENVYCPDIMFLAKDSTARFTERRVLGAPEFILEILSESTRRHDLGRKFIDYRSHGVGEIWFVDADRKEIIAARKSASYREEHASRERVASEAIPGFWIDPSWLWQPELPKSIDCLKLIAAP